MLLVGRPPGAAHPAHDRRLGLEPQRLGVHQQPVHVEHDRLQGAVGALVLRPAIQAAFRAGRGGAPGSGIAVSPPRHAHLGPASQAVKGRRLSFSGMSESLDTVFACAATDCTLRPLRR